jgi:hypothetical protein
LYNLSLATAELSEKSSISLFDGRFFNLNPARCRIEISLFVEKITKNPSYFSGSKGEESAGKAAARGVFS